MLTMCLIISVSTKSNYTHTNSMKWTHKARTLH